MFRFVIVKVKWRRCLSIPLARKDGNNNASTRSIALASLPRRRSVGFPCDARHRRVALVVTTLTID